MSKVKLTWEEESELSHSPNKRKITIEQNTSDLDIHDFLNSLIRPLLHAIGFQQKTIEDVIGEYY